MPAEKKDVKFEIIETLELLSESGNKTKEVNLVKWEKGGVKLDIRQWYTDKDGVKRPGKGISLNSEEAELMFNAISEDFDFDFDAE